MKCTFNPRWVLVTVIIYSIYMNDEHIVGSFHTKLSIQFSFPFYALINVKFPFAFQHHSLNFQVIKADGPELWIEISRRNKETPVDSDVLNIS